MQLATGFQAFLDMFGGITVLDVAVFIASIVFLILIYKKVKTYLLDKHDAEKLRNSQLQEALTSVRKYPEYRQQSIKIQELLEGEIQELRGEVKGLREMQEETTKRFDKIEEDTKRRERNKIRDTLLQNYRYYTNQETNPTHSWTKMEADAFWALFKEYEDNGGDGYMHSDVQPAMEKLTIIEHEPKI